MQNVREDGILLLRILSEYGAVGIKSLDNSELYIKSNLSREDFSTARFFILNSKFVNGAGGEEGGYISLTTLGVEYLNEELKKRVPLTLSAEIILKFLVNNIKDEQPTAKYLKPEVLSSAQVNETEYFDACRRLERLGYIEEWVSTGEIFGSVFATDEGAKVVYKNFFEDQRPFVNIQSGPTFQGPISAQNFQAFTNVINSEIEQTINRNDPDALEKIFSNLLDTILPKLTTLEEKSGYIETATELSNELKKDDPEIELLQKWITRLSFFDKIITTGKNTFEIAKSAMPYIMLIIQYISTHIK
jgi:hypothetical protein